MKINTTKLVVGVLAVAGVASLVGSISGTVAWFQYNTRTVAEFGGTTTKCSEYLEMRTVTGTGIHAAAKLAATTDSLTSLNVGDKVIVDGVGKVFTVVETTGETPTKALDSGKDISDGARYEVSDKVYAWNSTGTKWDEAKLTYGEWINYLDKDAMATLTGNTGAYKPVTAPGATSGAVLPDLKASPICGYADYSKWNDAEASDFMQFTLQFRVLDLDGSTPDETDNAKKDNDRAMRETNLYITDLTMEKETVGDKKDVTSALRFHVAGATATNNKLWGWGKGTNPTFTTDTHGELNLGGVDREANDIGLDVRNNYSFKGSDLYKPLVYGDSSSVQTVQDLKNGNTYIPTDDGKGNLTGGAAIGVTKEHAVSDATLEDDDYLTFTFTTWLEGWHEFEDAIDTTKTVDVKYIGIKPASATAGEKWFDYKNGKLHTYGAEGWDAGADADTTKIYTTDSGKTGMKHDGSAWKNVNNRIWSDVDYVGSKFNIGISFGVNALQ